MNLGLIKCLFFGHKIKRYQYPNNQPPQANSGIILGWAQNPHWLMVYQESERHVIIHPCENCHMMVAVEKRGKK